MMADCGGVFWRIAVVLGCVVLAFLREWGAVVALVALGAALQQGEENRRQHRLLVRPRLAIFSGEDWDANNPDVLSMKLTLMNNGIGPAIIDSFALLIDDEEIPIHDPAEIRPLLRQHIPHDFYGDKGLFCYPPGHVLKAGDAVPLGEILVHHPRNFAPEDVEQAARYQAQRLSKIGIFIRYSSMCDEEQPPYDSRHFNIYARQKLA